MRRTLTTLLTVSLMTITPGLIGNAFAHGGSYRGPAGEVPPDSREPSDPPPPPAGGGPTTPGGEPGGPSTGGGDIGGPSTGGGGGGPSTGGGGGGPSTGGGPSGPTTGGGGGAAPKKSGATGPGYEDWTFWWNFNKDNILQLKSEVKRTQGARRSGKSVHGFGRKKSGGTELVTATQAAIDNKIVPALRRMLEQKDLNFDIQSAAALALAKIGDETLVETIKKMATNERSTGKYHKVVVESAALAFGLLQKNNVEVREFLLTILLDEKRNSSFVRPFAAVSLGLLGSEGDADKAVTEGLLKVISRKESKNDIKPACFVALGLLGDDAVVENLLFMLENGKSEEKSADKLSDTELAFVVATLGDIGRPGTDKDANAVVAALTKRTSAKREKNVNVRRSAAIALAQLAPQVDVKGQKDIISTLTNVATEGKDTSEANFAMISLGRVGASKGIDDKTRQKTIEVLRYQLQKARPKNIKQPFAALALGLIGRQMVLDGKSPSDDDIRKPLRDKLDGEKNPRSRGAYAIALGLVKDKLAVDPLLKIFSDAGANARLRGYSAIALGMIGDSAAKAGVAKVLADEDENDRDLRVQTAVAAGLMGDAGVIEPPVTLLKTEESQYVLGSVALALGQIGDERAIDPLLEIADDTAKKYPDLTRALATVALGQIGDRRDVPVLSRVATDINYRAHVPALAELLTIL